MGVVEEQPIFEAVQQEHFAREPFLATTPERTSHLFTSSQSLAWVAHLAELAMRPCTILDLGSADGSLLSQFSSRWERISIGSGEGAVDGVSTLGEDLFDPMVRQRLGNRAQLITAIGFFQRLRDIRSGMTAALDLLSDDGLMLFETPLMEGTGPDEEWLDSSLGSVWYPTQQGIERLLRDELGSFLSGTECVVHGYASTYVGLVAKQGEQASLSHDLVSRVLCGPVAALHSAEERRTRALYQVLHAADTGDEARELLPALGDSHGLPGPNVPPERVLPADSDDSAQLGREKHAMDKRHDELRAELTRGLSHVAEQHDELRAELSRGLSHVAEQHDELRAELSHGLSHVAEQHDELRAELTRGLSRLERIGRDTLAHRTARRARGAVMLAKYLLDRRRARDVLRGAEVLVNADARRVWSEFFDPTEYLDTYGDVLRANAPAGLHYLILGFREGREPSARFSGVEYLRANRDVADADMNPLVHFALKGATEGRSVTIRPPSSTHPADVADSSWTNSRWPDLFPLVSIVIPCFNYGRSLRSAIDSVLSQTWVDLEVIVVEGGSTDPHSVTAVRELEAERLPHVTIYYRGGRRLVGDNRNFGISKARGRYVVCLDPDDALEPVYLEVALFLAEAYHYDLVYPSAQCFGDSEVTWLVSDTSFPELLRANTIPTVALFRRSAWVEAGGYRDWGIGDAHVPEDWAFWTRLVGMGYRSKAIRQPLMRYHVHAGSLSASSSADLQMYRESIRVANADLLESAASGKASPQPTVVVNAYDNLLAGEPAEAPRGAILIAMPLATVGGAERLMASLANSLAADGFRVIFTTSDPLPESMPNGSSLLRSATDQVYELPLLFAEPERQEAFFLFLLKRYRVQTLLIVGSRLAYELLPEIRRVSAHTGVIDQLFNSVGHANSHRRFTQLIDVAIVPSDALRTRLVEEWRVSSEVAVIEHALPPRDSGQAVRAPSPVGNQRRSLTIGFFGRWSEEKGPDLFVDICRSVSSASDASFLMTGDGPMRDHVLDLIKRSGLADRIRTVGFVPDVATLMADTDVVVVPSRLDGFPLVVLEAMAAGKPIVASAVGSLPEVIEDGVTGYLCTPGDISAFTSRILELCRSAGLREHMGFAAERLHSERYSWDRVYRLYCEEFARASALAAERTQMNADSTHAA